SFPPNCPLESLASTPTTPAVRWPGAGASQLRSRQPSIDPQAKGLPLRSKADWFDSNRQSNGQPQTVSSTNPKDLRSVPQFL
ncbi:MAG: hypothetical protein ACKN81_17595, partial [Pirellulaceae bacterium]